MKVRYYTRLYVEILRQGRTFADLHRETGIHPQTIYRYANDYRRVLPKDVIPLARALGVHADVITDRRAYVLDGTLTADAVAV